jgi:MOSC domain-containing protein YiiM
VAAVSRNEAYSFTKPNRDEIVLLTGLGVEGDVHAGVTVKHRGRVVADPVQPNLRQVHLIHAELFEEVGEQGFAVAPGQLGENVTTSGLNLLALPRGTILRFGPPPTPRANGDVAEGAASVAAIVEAAAKATLDAATAAALATLVEVAQTLSPSGRAPDQDGTDRDGEDQGGVARDGEDQGGGDREGADRRAVVVITGVRNPCGQINGFRPGLLKQVLGRDDEGNLVRKAGIMGVVLRGGPVRPGDPISVELPAPPYLPLERV